MTTRRFALAGLMRVRELQEERAAAELARANHARAQAAQQRADATAALAAMAFSTPARPMDDDVEDGPAPHPLEADHARSWHAVVAGRASLTALVGEYTQALHAASQVADEASADWTKARMRAAMIDKLKARHDHEVEVEDLRAEQLVLDEAALRRTKEVQ